MHDRIEILESDRQEVRKELQSVKSKLADLEKIQKHDLDGQGAHMQNIDFKGKPPQRNVQAPSLELVVQKEDVEYKFWKTLSTSDSRQNIVHLHISVSDYSVSDCVSKQVKSTHF